ncbi:hypothetical protein SFRURICE_014145 [Spodoptera frugiperda]|nr:hypothetical protein SFRURICE_014145 [Spodoptera frugiperda]
MPRVKIDYIVSFSSEDPEHPASNLLNLEVSKKKWLCAKGETTCSVVLQLPRAVKISSLNIGAYHAALVEVLVGRSESTNEQYQVLVPSCVFLSREESRRGAEPARVRSFSGEQLAQPARDMRWDRLRVICSQPHNKHCQFGLSFVHIDEAESSAPTGVPQRLLALDTFSSDEDDFKPGELFAKHLQKTNTEDMPPPSNTGAQIRQATSQALKNISDSSTKLMKNPINRPSGSSNDNKASTSRRPDVQVRQPGPRQDEGAPPRHAAQTSAPAETSRSAKKPNSDSEKSSADQNRDIKTKKRVRSESQERPAVPTECLLSGATLVLSGYVNPHRAAVRQDALALGARVLPDWGPTCTHLICAFPNTPKLRAVRAGPSGRAVPAARADWLAACRARRRLLPWQWFATEPERRIAPDEEPPHDVDSDQKKRRTEASPVQLRDDSDSDGQSTDEPGPAASPPPPGAGALPAFLDGCTFSLRAASAAAAPRLARYVRAYGGELLDDGDATDGATRRAH